MKAKTLYGHQVATCPACGAAIGDEHPQVYCLKCAARLPSAILALIPARRSEAVEEADTGLQEVVAVRPTKQAVVENGGPPAPAKREGAARPIASPWKVKRAYHRVEARPRGPARP
jgi:hypothetical protein